LQQATSRRPFSFLVRVCYAEQHAARTSTLDAINSSTLLQHRASWLFMRGQRSLHAASLAAHFSEVRK
jgi:hypothetical protein